jgi:hypothetical protein
MIIAPPIVIELGEIGDAQLNELLGGSGKLFEEVQEVMRLVRRGTAHEHRARTLLPIVAVYTSSEYLDTDKSSRQRAGRRAARKSSS